MLPWGKFRKAELSRTNASAGTVPTSNMLPGLLLWGRKPVVAGVAVRGGGGCGGRGGNNRPHFLAAYRHQRV